MRHLNRRSTQSGVVLVIGLLLLLIITIVAVASMSSTHMQERMAGNARTQVLAFEVASGGASDSLSFYEANVSQLTVCNDPEEWEKDAFSTEDQPVLRTIGPHQVRLTQYLYCLQSEILDEDEGPVLTLPQFFVLSRADVLAADGSTTIARRAIETRIRTPGQPDCGALCFLGCDEDDQYDFAMSNAYKVDGGDNPAITVPAECREKLLDAIDDKRIANYSPDGVTGFVGELPPPWTSPKTVDDFRKTLLVRMGATAPPPGVDAADPEDTTFYIDLDSQSALDTIEPNEGLNTEDPEQLLKVENPKYLEYGTRFINPESGTFTQPGSATFGTAAKPQITYIAGDADMAGSVSGTGILVVEGNLKWNGTPNFDGLILVLGGGFEVYGGGQGGNFAGSLMVVNIWNEHDPRIKDTSKGYYKHLYNKHDDTDPPAYLASKFGNVAVAFTGGGRANYTYNCESLLDYSRDLSLDPWSPACDSDDGGAVVLQIVSWRENIGWRVDFAD